jgi:HemY protein
VAQEITLKAHRENICQRSADRGSLLAYRHEVPSSEYGPRLARAFVEVLIELGVGPEAQELIEKQLDADWDPTLVLLYGRLQGGDPTARIACAEQWLPLHKDDPQLLLTLGRLCLAQRLWGKAQSYFEASLSLADRRETRLELAQLFEQTKRPDEAMPHYRAAADAPCRD